MKIIREDGGKKQTITIRLSERVMKQIDELTEEHDVSRQRLIEAILNQALADKNFVVHLE